MSAFLIILGVLAVFFILTRFAGDATRTWFMRLMKARRVAIAIGGAIVAGVLLFTGVVFLQIVGGAILLYALLVITYDPTLSEFKGFLKSLPVVNRVMA